MSTEIKEKVAAYLKYIRGGPYRDGGRGGPRRWHEIVSAATAEEMAEIAADGIKEPPGYNAVDHKYGLA
jgi:hypothetical protein